MNWKVWESGTHSAEENMRIDKELLEKASELEGPCVRFYEWERPSITYGYFIDPKKFLKLDRLEALGIDAARRPTGGGIVFHMFDMAFSVVVPSHSPLFSVSTLDNYKLVNQAVLKVAENLGGDLEMIPVDADPRAASCSHFCMARPTKYDVVWHERKIAGAAQRKTRRGFLHQGTIALQMPDEKLLSDVLQEEVRGSVMEAMQMHTHPLDVSKQKLKELLTVQLTSL